MIAVRLFRILTHSERLQMNNQISRPATATAADDSARLGAAWDRAAAKRKRDAAIRDQCSDMVTVSSDFKGW